MCNLSDGVEMRGIQRGIDKGTINVLMGYIRKKKMPIEAALDDLDIAASNSGRYTALLREQLQS